MWREGGIGVTEVSDLFPPHKLEAGAPPPPASCPTFTGLLVTSSQNCLSHLALEVILACETCTVPCLPALPLQQMCAESPEGQCSAE